VGRQSGCSAAADPGTQTHQHASVRGQDQRASVRGQGKKGPGEAGCGAPPSGLASTRSGMGRRTAEQARRGWAAPEQLHAARLRLLLTTSLLGGEALRGAPGARQHAESACEWGRGAGELSPREIRYGSRWQDTETGS
jgi:hypothetical protein